MKILLGTFCAFAVNLHAQFFQQDTSKKLRYMAAPVLFNAPETGFGYGLSGSMYFKTSNRKDTLTRLSTIQALGFWTTRKQNVQALDAYVFFPKEHYIFSGKLMHSYFPDRFWGIGDKTANTDWEHYLYEQVYFLGHLKKKVAKHFFVGLLYEFQYIYHIRYTENGVFDMTDFSGKQPYKMSGLGLSLCYDSRNRNFWTEKGVFIQSIFTPFRKELLSDYNVNKWVCDIRWFQKIVKGQILAVQLYNYSTFGNTPLKQMASFGGVDNMRGFYQGRFRDKNMTTLIAEYRYNFYKRFSLCIFGGTGNVFGNYSSFDFSSLKYSYGGGLRFALFKKDMINVRLDYGYSDKFNQGFYFTIGECF